MRAKKCPPGVICLENITITLIITILLVIGYLIYANLNKKQNININQHEKIILEQQPQSNVQRFMGGAFGFIPSFPYTNLSMPKNVLQNPYAPPLSDERYFIPELTTIPVGTIPINVSTNIGAVNTTYRQMGIAKPMNGSSENNILPLMGRPLFTNRDKWQYYTISNQHNNVKLPVLYQGKSALNDYGVNQINSGDTIYVEGYNEPFSVTMYENDTIKYLPFV